MPDVTFSKTRLHTTYYIHKTFNAPIKLCTTFPDPPQKLDQTSLTPVKISANIQTAWISFPMRIRSFALSRVYHLHMSASITVIYNIGFPLAERTWRCTRTRRCSSCPGASRAPGLRISTTSWTSPTRRRRRLPRCTAPSTGLDPPPSCSIPRRVSERFIARKWGLVVRWNCS